MPSPGTFDIAPWRFSGTVVCAMLNHAPVLRALGDAVNAAPYKAAPREPVLAVRPRNTWSDDGAAIEVPSEPGELEVGATLGIVIGRVACAVPARAALDHIAGFTVVNDLCVPHDSHYRPAIRMKARDGFCAVSHRVVPAVALASPDALAVRVSIDGKTVHETTTGERIRGVAQLVADVSDFMTLHPGDLLLLGVAAQAPRARAGQTVIVDIDQVGSITNSFVAQARSS